MVAARAANAVYPSHQRRRPGRTVPGIGGLSRSDGRPASAKIHKHKRVADARLKINGVELPKRSMRSRHLALKILSADCSSAQVGESESTRNLKLSIEKGDRQGCGKAEVFSKVATSFCWPPATLLDSYSLAWVNTPPAQASSRSIRSAAPVTCRKPENLSFPRSCL